MNEKWKERIVLFLASQTISLFGSSLVQYAINWYITLTTQSAIMMTISIICGFLPAFFISPFAGVWADRYNRKILIVLADSLIAISTLIIAILFFLGYDKLWLLFVISAIRSVGTGIQTPAVGAFIPQIVPEDKLTQVNAANGSIQSMIMLLSPAISGALLSFYSIQNIFLVDVITAAIAILTLTLFLNITANAVTVTNEKTSYFKDMKEGIIYIRNHDYVKAFFAFCTLFFVLVSPAAFLTPLQVTRSYGSDVWRLTAIEIAFAGGMLVGGIIMLSWGGFKNKVYTMVFANMAIGIFTMALGITPAFWIYLIFMGVVGITMPFFNTPSTVLLQQKVEPEYLGRVFGIMGMISSIMMPSGMLIFGPLADYVKIEWILLGTGLSIIILSGFILRNKALVEAGKPTG
ncbi:MAG: enterobactin exporter EntS [Firmicutes bacterium ADurb.Bin419]|nr:MAG: enterobactin exporter EntS [Firmicutes bacterium ADurb.Bin419]